MTRLTDKVAAITGGASGIGEATARRFVQEGAKVVILDLDTERGGRIAAELGTAAECLPHDVTDEQAWQSNCRSIVDRHGRMDILVNSAGISQPGSIEDASAELWQRTHLLNAESVFLGCKYGVEAIKDNSSAGAIVNISSTFGLRPGADQVSYSSSKASVIAVTRSVALHCAQKRYPVRVNAINPGATHTPMMDWYLEQAEDRDALYDLFSSLHPMGRVATPEEMASAILFLASDEASFITGVSLPVDGGYCAV